MKWGNTGRDESINIHQNYSASVDKNTQTDTIKVVSKLKNKAENLSVLLIPNHHEIFHKIPIANIKIGYRLNYETISEIEVNGLVVFSVNG